MDFFKDANGICIKLSQEAAISEELGLKFITPFSINFQQSLKCTVLTTTKIHVLCKQEQCLAVPKEEKDFHISPQAEKTKFFVSESSQ